MVDAKKEDYSVSVGDFIQQGIDVAAAPLVKSYKANTEGASKIDLTKRTSSTSTNAGGKKEGFLRRIKNKVADSVNSVKNSKVGKWFGTKKSIPVGKYVATGLDVANKAGRVAGGAYAAAEGVQTFKSVAEYGQTYDETTADLKNYGSTDAVKMADMYEQKANTLGHAMGTVDGALMASKSPLYQTIGLVGETTKNLTVGYYNDQTDAARQHIAEIDKAREANTQMRHAAVAKDLSSFNQEELRALLAEREQALKTGGATRAAYNAKVATFLGNDKANNALPLGSLYLFSPDEEAAFKSQNNITSDLKITKINANQLKTVQPLEKKGWFRWGKEKVIGTPEERAAKKAEKERKKQEKKAQKEQAKKEKAGQKNGVHTTPAQADTTPQIPPPAPVLPPPQRPEPTVKTDPNTQKPASDEKSDQTAQNTANPLTDLFGMLGEFGQALIILMATIIAGISKVTQEQLAPPPVTSAQTPQQPTEQQNENTGSTVAPNTTGNLATPRQETIISENNIYNSTSLTA